MSETAVPPGAVTTADLYRKLETISDSVIQDGGADQSAA